MARIVVWQIAALLTRTGIGVAARIITERLAGILAIAATSCGIEVRICIGAGQRQIELVRIRRLIRIGIVIGRLVGIRI